MPGLCYGSCIERDAAGTILESVFGIYMRIIGHLSLQGARNVIGALLKGGPESKVQYVENGKLQP